MIVKIYSETKRKELPHVLGVYQVVTENIISERFHFRIDWSESGIPLSSFKIRITCDESHFFKFVHINGIPDIIYTDRVIESNAVKSDANKFIPFQIKKQIMPSPVAATFTIELLDDSNFLVEGGSTSVSL